MGIVINSTDQYQTCINECNRCAQACLECMTACLNEPDVQARRSCITMLAECAGICREAVCFMSMGAPHAKELCKLCAVICDKCACECGAFQDSHCVKCAQECKKCSDECNSMG
ncbi:MAG: four-helix bundle copper-binding protein [Clostridiales bacterium]|nr:four-helix bundle copper-binding protein [Clostridiales bacterium]